MRKGNMARGRERCGGAKFGVGGIERAHTSEEKTKTWNDSLTTPPGWKYPASRGGRIMNLKPASKLSFPPQPQPPSTDGRMGTEGENPLLGTTRLGGRVAPKDELEVLSSSWRRERRMLALGGDDEALQVSLSGTWPGG